LDATTSCACVCMCIPSGISNSILASKPATRSQTVRPHLAQLNPMRWRPPRPTRSTSRPTHRVQPMRPAQKPKTTTVAA
jgi:hypothetical protein